MKIPDLLIVTAFILTLVSLPFVALVNIPWQIPVILVLLAWMIAGKVS